MEEGILVSATGANVGSLTKEDLTLVVEIDGNKIKWKGEKHPSSEMPIISEIYRAMTETGALIHTHKKN